MLPFFRPLNNSSILLFRAQTRLSTLHHTSITMPRHKSSGKKKNGVPKKPPLTHFLCIPLVTPTSRPQLETSIKKFKEDICTAASTGSVTEDPTFLNTSEAEDKATNEGAEGNNAPTNDQEQSTPPSQASSISEKAVRPVDTLHLTLGVMSLDKDKLAQAISLLNTLDIPSLLQDSKPPSGSELSPPEPQPQPHQPSDKTSPQPIEPITVTLQGLTSMHNPHSTSILYISPQDPTLRLQTLCTNLSNLFTASGFLVPDSRPLKLHATVLNAIYVKGRRGPKPKNDAGTSISARPKRSEDTVPEDNRDGKPGDTEGSIRTPQPPGKPTEKAATATPKTANEKVQAQEKDNKDLVKNTGKAGKAEEQEAKEDTASNTGHGPNAKSPLKLDARNILQRYKDFIWAEGIKVDRIAICEMGAKKTLDAKGTVVGEKYREVGVRIL